METVFTEENKGHTLAISTVRGRFRNVTRRVHPYPGKGPLACPHLTSAGREERGSERQAVSTHPPHVHTHDRTSQDLMFSCDFSHQICLVTLFVTS